MGAWGTDIFDDDFACDIRDDYKDILAASDSTVKATDQLLEEYDDLSEEDVEAYTVFWLALAATQLDQNILEDRVKQKALTIIDSNTNTQYLQKLKEQLLAT